MKYTFYAHQFNKGLVDMITNDILKETAVAKTVPITRKTILENEIARLQAELHRITNLPKEPALYSVVIFSKNFGGPIDYTYAALRTEKGWFLTGKEVAAKTWEQLLDFIIETENDADEALYKILIQRSGTAKYLVNP